MRGGEEWITSSLRGRRQCAVMVLGLGHQVPTPTCIQVLGDNGAGSYSNVIAGLAWVKQHVQANGNWPAVVSMSLGGSYSPSINEAASELIAVCGWKEGLDF